MPGPRPESDDTDPAVVRRMTVGLRAAPSWRKAEMITAMARAGHDLSLAGLRLRHPDADERELLRRATALRLGVDPASLPDAPPGTGIP